MGNETILLVPPKFFVFLAYFKTLGSFPIQLFISQKGFCFYFCTFFSQVWVQTALKKLR